MKRKIYIAYGSNMSLEQMKHRCPDAKLVGTGILKDYRLAFRYNGVANIEADEGNQVPVVIWAITQGCEKLLDIYEGFPRLYTKSDIKVQTTTLDILKNWSHDLRVDKTAVNATDSDNTNRLTLIGMAYIMTDAFAYKTALPRKDYYKTIHDAYTMNDFDISILQSSYDESFRARCPQSAGFPF